MKLKVDEFSCTQPKCVVYGTNDIFSLHVIHMWYCHVAQIKKAPYDIKCTLHDIQMCSVHMYHI